MNKNILKNGVGTYNLNNCSQVFQNVSMNLSANYIILRSFMYTNNNFLHINFAKYIVYMSIKFCS